MRKVEKNSPVLLAAMRSLCAGVLSLSLLAGAFARETYLEPGSLRFSHTLALEGVIQKLRPGWKVQRGDKQDLDHTFRQEGNEDNPWKTDWGQQFLTEVAARITRDLSGRFLFEIQGDYADRFFRPLNVNHHTYVQNDHVIFREAEGRWEKDNGYLYGFSGVGQGDWTSKGDFFKLYPQAIGERDYLGSSGYFGIYPGNWRQDQYLDISHRQIPRGGEGALTWQGVTGRVAYGDELSWGFRKSVYGNLEIPVWTSNMTFTYMDEDVPYSVYDDEERNRAYALSWRRDFSGGHQLDIGGLYNPFRVGDKYEIAREVPAGTGLLGSSWDISEKTSTKEDALGARIRYEHKSVAFDRLWEWALDYTHREILAGNKDQVDVLLGSDISEFYKGSLQYTYRKPIEGPVPFLYEGTPDNIGAVASNPRGADQPFWVNNTNREATFVLATLQYDPTPGTNFFVHDPKALSMWNVNPEEDSDISMAFQYRMTDYPTATDHQYYFDSQGNIVWEPAAHTGAWATKHPLHEARFLSRGKLRDWGWALGVAGGQTVARLGIAYGNDAGDSKSITEYLSFEGQLHYWPFSFWGHYGSGMWGPEENIHPEFGLAYDRLWGLGVSYNITVNTTWDIGYLAAREEDGLFVASSLGSYDEIRTVFSHRFGFLINFKEESRRGFRAR